jgi:hypothetical protein
MNNKTTKLSQQVYATFDRRGLMAGLKREGSRMTPIEPAAMTHSCSARRRSAVSAQSPTRGALLTGGALGDHINRRSEEGGAHVADTRGG